MIWTSPFAICVYLIVAFSLITTIFVRLTKEKVIASILTSPERRTRTIKLHRQMIKVNKLLLFSFPLAIAVMLVSYFTITKEDLFLFMSGFLAIIVIHSIEDIQFRKGMISRLENAEIVTAPQLTKPEVSPAVIAARIRKVRIIFFLVFAVFILGPLVALYFTLDMPWWLFLALSAFWLIVMVISIAIGLKRAKKELNSQKANDKQL
jgi:hypothetical protein